MNRHSIASQSVYNLFSVNLEGGKCMSKIILVLMFLFCFTLADFAQAQEKQVSDKNNSPVKILNVPQPALIGKADRNGTFRTVRLRVTFLAEGKIGKVGVVGDSSDEFTESAIEAARRIKFKPALKDGKPITTTKNVEFNFGINRY